MAKVEKKKPKYSKIKFIAAFCVAMALFASIRHGFSLNIPMHASHTDSLSTQTDTTSEEMIIEDTKLAEVPEVPENTIIEDTVIEKEAPLQIPASQKLNNGHRVIGVWSWKQCFPDSQSVQVLAAEKNGVHPCRTRREALQLIARHKLVNISNSPYYMVDDLKHSMPYLVPKAQHLLNTICLNFLDSLQVKGIPPHLPMITSVFRTTDDVSTLQRGNRNATTNSCHCYGTTVDITYNRFVPMTGSYDPNMELTRWSLPMKQVMAEVLRDLREQGLCYVKYENHQACFHLTVR